MKTPFTSFPVTVTIDNDQLTRNESTQDQRRMPPLKTRCPDTEAPPDGERLALDEYFKDADWNLVDPGNEPGDPEVLDVECEHPPIGAFMIDPEAQDAGMPPLSEQQAEAKPGENASPCNVTGETGQVIKSSAMKTLCEAGDRHQQEVADEEAEEMMLFTAGLFSRYGFDDGEQIHEWQKRHIRPGMDIFGADLLVAAVEAYLLPALNQRVKVMTSRRELRFTMHNPIRARSVNGKKVKWDLDDGTIDFEEHVESFGLQPESVTVTAEQLVALFPEHLSVEETHLMMEDDITS